MLACVMQLYVCVGGGVSKLCWTFYCCCCCYPVYLLRFLPTHSSIISRGGPTLRDAKGSRGCGSPTVALSFYLLLLL